MNATCKWAGVMLVYCDRATVSFVVLVVREIAGICTGVGGCCCCCDNIEVTCAYDSAADDVLVCWLLSIFCKFAAFALDWVIMVFGRIDYSCRYLLYDGHIIIKKVGRHAT